MGSSAAAVSSSVCIFFPATPSLPQNGAQAAPSPVTSEGRDLPGGAGSSVTPSAASRYIISRWRGLRQIGIIYSWFIGSPCLPSASSRADPAYCFGSTCSILRLRAHRKTARSSQSQSPVTLRNNRRWRHLQWCSSYTSVCMCTWERVTDSAGGWGGGQPESRISPAAPHRFLDFLRKGEENKRAASKYGNQNTNVRLRLTLFGRVCTLLWVPIDVIYQQPPPHLFTWSRAPARVSPVELDTRPHSGGTALTRTVRAKLH